MSRESFIINRAAGLRYSAGETETKTLNSTLENDELPGGWWTTQILYVGHAAYYTSIKTTKNHMRKQPISLLECCHYKLVKSNQLNKHLEHN